MEELEKLFDQRFLSKIQKTIEGCWEWQAAITYAGYGQYNKKGKSCRAHRFSYEIAKGNIPEGYHIDHLCRNRACVNPAHLEAVTPKENTRRSNHIGKTKRQQTHCKWGHEFTPENTYVKSNGCRACKECARRRDRENWRFWHGKNLRYRVE